MWHLQTIRGFLRVLPAPFFFIIHFLHTAALERVTFSSHPPTAPRSFPLAQPVKHIAHEPLSSTFLTIWWYKGKTKLQRKNQWHEDWKFTFFMFFLKNSIPSRSYSGWKSQKVARKGSGATIDQKSDAVVDNIVPGPVPRCWKWKRWWRELGFNGRWLCLAAVSVSGCALKWTHGCRAAKVAAKGRKQYRSCLVSSLWKLSKRRGQNKKKKEKKKEKLQKSEIVQTTVVDCCSTFFVFCSVVLQGFLRKITEMRL